MRNTQQLVRGWAKTNLHKVSLIIDPPVSLTHSRHWWPPGQSRPHLTHLEVNGGRKPLPPFATTSPTQRGHRHPDGCCWMLPGNSTAGRGSGEKPGHVSKPTGGAR